MRVAMSSRLLNRQMRNVFQIQNQRVNVRIMRADKRALEFAQLRGRKRRPNAPLLSALMRIAEAKTTARAQCANKRSARQRGDKRAAAAAAVRAASACDGARRCRDCSWRRWRRQR